MLSQADGVQFVQFLDVERAAYLVVENAGQESHTVAGG